MTGVTLFSVFSLACGLAVSPGMLIATRVLQVAAGAILSPSVYSIVSVTFEEGSERNKALGILGAIAGSGAAIGVLIGGVLTEFAGWEWIFFVNVPIGFVALLIVARRGPRDRAALVLGPRRPGNPPPSDARRSEPDWFHSQDLRSGVTTCGWGPNLQSCTRPTTN